MRAKLQPLLEKQNVKDEELMERVNVAVSAEMERFNKLHSGLKKSPKVNQIAQMANKQKGNDVDSQHGDAKGAKTNKLMATLEAVQSDLSYLKGVVDKSQTTSVHASNANNNARLRNNDPDATTDRCPRRRCDACNESNNKNCDHCFKCGSFC